MDYFSFSLTDYRAFGLISLPVLFAVLAVWGLVWKAVGLWFSARNYQKGWFTVMFIIETFSILPIVYLIWFRRDKQEGVTKSLFEKEPLPAEVEDQEIVSAA